MGAIAAPFNWKQALLRGLPIVEDFASASVSNASVGQYGWRVFLSTSGAMSQQPSTPGHFGIFNISSGATASSYAGIALWGTNSAGPLLPADGFDHLWLIKLGQSDANTVCRVGMAGVDPSVDPPDSGVYFEKLGADTNWFSVVRKGGVQTRTDTGVPTTTNWILLGIRYIDATHIEFTCGANAAPVPISSANVPLVSLTPFKAMSNNATANAKQGQADLMYLQPGVMART